MSSSGAASITNDSSKVVVISGKGFGATYKFRHYPARIDYIFVDEKMTVKKFENFPKFINSDHFPIMARLSYE